MHFNDIFFFRCLATYSPLFQPKFFCLPQHFISFFQQFSISNAMFNIQGVFLFDQLLYYLILGKIKNKIMAKRLSLSIRDLLSWIIKGRRILSKMNDSLLGRIFCVSLYSLFSGWCARNKDTLKWAEYKMEILEKRKSQSAIHWRQHNATVCVVSFFTIF